MQDDGLLERSRPEQHALGGIIRFLPDARRNRSSTADSAPLPEYQTAPEYPVNAVDKGEPGTVTLNISVDATGPVARVAVDSAKAPAPVALQTAAVEAANNWRFYPGMKSGRSVAEGIEVPVTFVLQPQSLRARGNPRNNAARQEILFLR